MGDAALQTRRLRWLASVLRFVAVFVILQAGYFLVSDGMSIVINQHLNAGPASWLTNLVIPGESIRAHNGMLVGPQASIDIRKGCEGFEVMFLLVAGMIAFPMKARMRLAGIVSGVLFIYVLNLLRLTGLYLTARYYPDFLQFAHVTVGQTLVILLAALYLYSWITFMPIAAGKVAGRS